MRARRSWSQTDVRLAPNRRFAPMQSFPVPRTASSTRRRARMSGAALGDRLQVGLARRARAIERERERVADRSRLAHLFRRRSLSQLMTSTPIGFCIWASGTSTADSVPRYPAAPRMTRETSATNCGFRPGTARREPSRPARDRRADDRHRTPRSPAACRRCGRTGKEWSSGPRRPRRHGGGAPAAGRSAGPWP